MQVTIEDLDLSDFESAIETFASLDEVDTSYLYEEEFLDGDLEIRAFPMGDEECGESGELEKIRVAVTVDSDADWYENVSAYGMANMDNGGVVYESIHEEISDAFESATGKSVGLIARKGSDTFSAAPRF